MILISFWTQDSNIKTGTIRNPLQNSQLIHDPLYFQNPRIRSIYRKNPKSVRFLMPNLSIRKPIHPPLNVSHSRKDKCVGEKVGKQPSVDWDPSAACHIQGQLTGLGQCRQVAWKTARWVSWRNSCCQQHVPIPSSQREDQQVEVVVSITSVWDRRVGTSNTCPLEFEVQSSHTEAAKTAV